MIERWFFISRVRFVRLLGFNFVPRARTPAFIGPLRTCDSRRKDPVDRLDSLIGRSSRARVKEKFEFESLLRDPIGWWCRTSSSFYVTPSRRLFSYAICQLEEKSPGDSGRRIKIYSSSFYHFVVHNVAKVLQIKCVYKIMHK